MNKARKMDNALFEGGPLLGLQRRVGLVRNNQSNVVQRAVLVVLICWLPLVVLAAVQSVVLNTDGVTPLLWEIGAHARYLVAAPLLILAESECARRLNVIAYHFVDVGLVEGRDRARFDAAVTSTRRLLNSHAAEIAIVLLAYLVAAAAAYSQPIDSIPAWHKTGGMAPAFSPAGWWHVLVSLPLLLGLLLAWMWRLVLWTRFLWLLARLDLHLVASHPDHAAGLGFVGYSSRAFYIVALAIASIIAGRSAHIVLLGGALPTQNVILNGGLLLAIVAMFVAPLLIFSPVLMNAWRHGALKYSALADQVGTAFEGKWLALDGQVDNVALDKPDLSATTDLYSIVANVHALRLVPIDLRSIVMLGGAMLLSFFPVVLLALPAEQNLAGLKELLF